MIPTDSVAFDVNAQACGMLPAMVMGVSRSYLERGASTRYLQPVVLDGYLRWLDEGPACGF